MSDTSTISVDIDISDNTAAIGIAVWLDNTCVYQTDHLAELIHVEHAISDDEGQRELRIVISGKNEQHTIIDEQENIIKDVVITVSNVLVDGMNISQLFNDTCVYTHDFNGSQPEIKDTFHGIAGCNGVISFQFTTPMYLWLLENM